MRKEWCAIDCLMLDSIDATAAQSVSINDRDDSSITRHVNLPVA
jgi:hypothetical protein